MINGGQLTGGKLGPPVCIVFEGWDAAGKGGAIKRLVEPLDPRHVHIAPFAAPTPDELRHHFLWRFWPPLPGWGGMTIFDRSWYGRVLVERVEDLATEVQWRRAYDEINDFEHSLAEEGMVVIKLWMHMSHEEQLRRFERRRDDPLKSWKLTDEDWRNREKRPQYDEAVSDMLRLTSGRLAPWDVISSESKRNGRVEVIETVIRRMEEGMARWGIEVPSSDDEEEQRTRRPWPSTTPSFSPTPRPRPRPRRARPGSPGRGEPRPGGSPGERQRQLRRRPRPAPSPHPGNRNEARLMTDGNDGWTAGSRYGITIPFDTVPLHAHKEWFARLRALGYTDLWSAEVDGSDGFTPLALAAAWEPDAQARRRHHAGLHAGPGAAGPERRLPRRRRPGPVRLRPRGVLRGDRGQLERAGLREPVPAGARHPAFPPPGPDRREGHRRPTRGSPSPASAWPGSPSSSPTSTWPPCAPACCIWPARRPTGSSSTG